jgi:hypothetical protein
MSSISVQAISLHYLFSRLFQAERNSPFLSAPSVVASVLLPHPVLICSASTLRPGPLLIDALFISDTHGTDIGTCGKDGISWVWLVFLMVQAKTWRGKKI